MPVEWHCRHCRLRPASWCLSPLSLPPPATHQVPTPTRKRRFDVPSARPATPAVAAGASARNRSNPKNSIARVDRPTPSPRTSRCAAPNGATGSRPPTPNESRVSCAARHRTGSSGHRVRGLETTTSVSMPRYRGRGGRGRGLETTALASMPRCLADSRPRPTHQCRPHLGNRGRGLETTASVSMPRYRGRGGRGRGLVSRLETTASVLMSRYRGRGGRGRGLETTA